MSYDEVDIGPLMKIIIWHKIKMNHVV